MWLFSNLLDRVAGQADSKLLENLLVYFAEHYSRMNLTSVKFRKLVKCLTAIIVGVAQERNGNKNLV